MVRDAPTPRSKQRDARVAVGYRSTIPHVKPIDQTILTFENTDAWDAWLTKHHATSSSGLWIKLGKVASGEASITYVQALEIALTWGWIDGQKKSHCEVWWLQRFTPRKPRSQWSKINVEKAEALIAAGRMHATGQVEVDRARNDGRWQAAYDSPSRAIVPDDLADALQKQPAAREFFATLNAANRYAVLYRIQTAKKPDTRARRIATLLAMLARQEKLHP